MRKRFAVAALLLALLTCGSAAADEKTDADNKAITGTWTPVSLEMAGEKRDAASEPGALPATFKDGKVLLNDAEIFSYKLDAGTDPKIIDLTKLKDPDKDQVLEGIYKFDGEMLMICLWNGQGTKARPAEFATKAGDNFVLVVLKRG
jgi:uncharacterized protein (TIGR03067 family)